MFTLTGGQKVAGGTYWDITTGLRVDMDQEGVLPGGNSSKYIKASSGAMLLAGPILGLIYIITLPIMGVVTALFLLAQRPSCTSDGGLRNPIWEARTRRKTTTVPKSRSSSNRESPMGGESLHYKIGKGGMIHEHDV
jgi:hypothetical protein